MVFFLREIELRDSCLYINNIWMMGCLYSVFVNYILEIIIEQQKNVVVGSEIYSLLFFLFVLIVIINLYILLLFLVILYTFVNLFICVFFCTKETTRAIIIFLERCLLLIIELRRLKKMCDYKNMVYLDTTFLLYARENSIWKVFFGVVLPLNVVAKCCKHSNVIVTKDGSSFYLFFFNSFCWYIILLR